MTFSKIKLNPSGKQILLVAFIILVVLTLSGFVTNRKPKKQSLTNTQLEEKKEGDILRLQQADSHLDRITTPLSVLKEQALNRNE